MDENCRAFCPIAELCVRNHERILHTLESAEVHERRTRETTAAAADSIAVSEASVALGEAAIQLARDGILHPDGDQDEYIDKALEHISDHRRRIAENIPLYEERLKESRSAKGKLLKSHKAMESSHVNMALVEEAQLSCDGPKLTWAGRLKFGKAVARAWLRQDDYSPREADKKYLYKRGYATCPKLKR